jgi:hypothetical protein
MTLFKASDALDLIESIKRLRTLWHPAPDNHEQGALYYAGAVKELEGILTTASALSLRYTHRIATNVITLVRHLTKANFDLCGLEQASVEIEKAAMLELRDVNFVFVRHDHVALYSATHPFGEEWKNGSRAVAMTFAKRRNVLLWGEGRPP